MNKIYIEEKGIKTRFYNWKRQKMGEPKFTNFQEVNMEAGQILRKLCNAVKSRSGGGGGGHRSEYGNQPQNPSQKIEGINRKLIVTRSGPNSRKNRTAGSTDGKKMITYKEVNSQNL